MKFFHKKKPVQYWEKVSLFLSQKKHRKDYERAILEFSYFLTNKKILSEEEERQTIIRATIKDGIRFVIWQRNQEGEAGNLNDDTRRSNSTIFKRLSLLQHFYSYLKEQGEVSENPFFGVKKPSPRVGRKRGFLPLSNEEVCSMLNACENVKEKALLAVLFGAGIRRNEVCNLKIKDVYKNGDYCFLFLRNTKSHRDIEQQISPDLAGLVEDLRDYRLKWGADPENSLFAGIHGGRIDGSTLFKMFQRIAKRAGIKRSVSLHCARATAITKLLEVGVSLELVKDFARHSTIEATLLYDKRQMHGEKSPVRKLRYFSS